MIQPAAAASAIAAASAGQKDHSRFSVSSAEV